MANTLSAPHPQGSAQSWLKASGIALALVLLVAVVGGSWLLRAVGPRARAQVEPSLHAAATPEQVPPYLALLMLADYPPEQVWREPLARGEWEGALALWSFGPQADDAARADALLAIAEASARAAPDLAASCLLAAADVARLSPTMGDRARAERLIAVGEMLSGLGLRAAALDEGQQARLLAHYSPALAPHYRRTLLTQIAQLFRSVGARDAADATQREAGQVAERPTTVETSVPPLPTGELPAAPPALLEARARRQHAAQVAAQAITRGEGDAAYAVLRDALSAEGLQQRLWVDEQLALPLPAEQRAALLEAHVSWLQRERLLAYGYGGQPFAPWMQRRAQLDAALGEMWLLLQETRLAQSVALGEQERVTLAQRAWWAHRLLQGRLGRDPSVQVEAIVASMRPNNADGAGGDMLRLDWIAGRWWRVPRTFVGTDSLPR